MYHTDDSDEGEKDLTQMLLEEMDDIESVRSADSGKFMYLIVYFLLNNN